MTETHCTDCKTHVNKLNEHISMKGYGVPLCGRCILIRGGEGEKK